MTRPRYPIEWVIAAMGALGTLNDRQHMVDLLWETGHPGDYTGPVLRHAIHRVAGAARGLA